MSYSSGIITALNGTIVALTDGDSTIVFNVTGTWSATLQIQATVDGTNWFTVSGYVLASQAVVSSFSVNQAISVSCAGFAQVQLIATSFTSGTINIAWDISNAANNTSQVYSTSAQSFIAWAQLRDGVGNNITSQASGSQTALDVGIDVAGVQIDPRNIVPPTLTKGTQGSTGFSVQDLKDAGRTYVTFTADAIAGVTSEALISFTQNRQGTTTGSVTSYTVTSGKTLRIQSITVGVQSGAAAGEWVRAKLRHNTAGATTASSALVYTTACGTSTAASPISGQVSVPIPDGLEFYGNGTQTIGMSHLSSATTNVESITICGYEY